MQYPGEIKGIHILPVRFMLGFVWLMGGVLNLFDLFVANDLEKGSEKYSTLIGTVWSRGLSFELPVPSTIYLPSQIPANPIPGMSWFLESVAAPNAAMFMSVMATLEILIGISILFGIFARASPIGATLMNVAIIISAGHTHPAILRTNLLMAAMALTIYLTKAGRVYGVDSWLSRKVKRVPILNKMCA